MNCEKEQNEVIDKLKSLIGDAKKQGHIIVRIEDIEKIIPETKESEDERIRKELLEHCKNQAKPYIQTGNKCPQIQSWIAWLEKQGEKEETLCDRCKKEQPSHSCQDITALGRCYIKGMSTSNKVEPKFIVEEGKWYICTQTFVLRGKIVVIKGQVYQAQENSAIKGEEGCLFVDKHDGKASEYFRLWTIQDAKDGDVLYHKAENGIEYIVMNKGLNEHNNIDSYFRYNSINGFGIDIPSVLSAKCDSITPATKEQRDLLFQKMHEAGYEWDAEKKEPKKIEDRVEKALHKAGYEWSEETHHLKKIVQKPAKWSEEDEEHIKRIIEHFEGRKKDLKTQWVAELHNKEITWLKSLKDRMQPKQEWSEEDNHEHFSELLENDNSDNIDDYAYQCAYCMSHDWIKESPTWDDVERACKLGAEWNEKHHKSAWSEEDKDFMYDTLSNLAELKGRYGEGYGNVGKCIDWLKSLKDRIGG